MPAFKRPDAEIYCEVHGSGYPLLLFAPGGLRSQLAFSRHSSSAEIARLAPHLEIQTDWRGPAHLADRSGGSPTS